MTKNVLLTVSSLLLLAVFGACQPKEATTYTIHGEVAGDADGKQVYLYPITDGNAMDSTTIADNKFIFEGTMDSPERVRLVIDANPEDKKGNQRGFKQSYFYLENRDIQFITHIDSMPSLFYNPNVKTVAPEIKGSQSQDLYISYTASIKDLNAEYRDLDGKYNVEYHQPAMEGIFNLERGLELQKQIDEVMGKLDKKKMEFIRNHADSRVAFDLVDDYFQYMMIDITVEEIDELMSALKPSWGGTEKYAELEKVVDSARKRAIGSKYIDITVQDAEGNDVKLSDFIQPNKYTLIEFWATWCGPCRAEIPHLKHVYDEYKDKGFDVINISFDDSHDQWQKTLKEEGMTWTQLIDTDHFEGEAAKAYRIMGIPYSLMIDPNGIIIGADMRGAKLDLLLQEKI